MNQKSDNLEPSLSVEQCDQQPEDGIWQQPTSFGGSSEDTATITVPQGAFARLKWARACYVELSKEEFAAYGTVSGSSAIPASEFAINGDMPTHAARDSAAAEASGVFDDIIVFVPPTRLAGKLDATIIGIIETIGGDRYFRINVPTNGTMGVRDVVCRVRLSKYVMLIVSMIVFIAPIALAIFTNNASWFMLCLIGVFVIVGMLLYFGI